MSLVCSGNNSAWSRSCRVSLVATVVGTSRSITWELFLLIDTLDDEGGGVHRHVAFDARRSGGGVGDMIAMALFVQCHAWQRSRSATSALTAGRHRGTSARRRATSLGSSRQVRRACGCRGAQRGSPRPWRSRQSSRTSSRRGLCSAGTTQTPVVGCRRRGSRPRRGTVRRRLAAAMAVHPPRRAQRGDQEHCRGLVQTRLRGSGGRRVSR
jgi:hypothetical protein